MAGRVFLSLPYLGVRFGLWAVLFLLALVDGCRHRRLRSRGFQLFWALVGSTAAFLIRDTFLLATGIQGDSGTWLNQATFKTYIFFSDAADSYFVFILLIVAAGFCITRNNLGPHKTVCIVIPLIFFVTSLVVDYVLYAVRGFEAFSAQPDSYYEDQDAALGEEDVGPLTGLVFFICVVANTMAFLLSWFYIFDTIQKERELLEDGHRDPSAIDGMHLAPGLPVSSAPGAGKDEGVGHSAVPNQVLLEEGQNASHMHYYGDVAPVDLDAPKTVQDQVENQEKLRLIRRFFYGVCFYIVATILALFVPVFLDTGAVDRVILILQNTVLWVFLAVMLWTFRMRQGSQYLVLDEAAGAAGTETGGLVEMTANPYAPSGANGGGGGRFTLSEEEEHDGHAAGRQQAGPSAARQSAVNAAAAEHGVVVSALPTPRQ